MQKAEQKVNTVKIGVNEEWGGINTFVNTSVKCVASIRSKKSKKFPIRTIATDFLINGDRAVDLDEEDI
jgi:hypothetical protein